MEPRFPCLQRGTNTGSVPYGVEGDEIFRAALTQSPRGYGHGQCGQDSVCFRILLGCFPPPDAKPLGSRGPSLSFILCPRPGTEQAVCTYLVGAPRAHSADGEMEPRRVEGLAQGHSARGGPLRCSVPTCGESRRSSARPIRPAGNRRRLVLLRSYGLGAGPAVCVC